MTVTLYTPGESPRLLTPEGFSLPDADSGLAHISSRIAEELGCTINLVDVLDSGPGYCAYSIFDSEAEVNNEARLSLKAVSRYPAAWDSDDEESIIRGPILIVQHDQ